MKNSRQIKDAVVRKYPSIQMDDTLEKVVLTMARNNVSALVVFGGEELIGLVTITDVMYSLANDSDLRGTSISSFMTRCDIISDKEMRNPCVQLDEDQDVHAAIKVMSDAGVNHLLVSGCKGQPIGVVSSLELVKFLAS